MLHHRKRDPAWSAFDLDVAYSGPGALVITRGGKVEATRKLHFKGGRLDTIENAGGTLTVENGRFVTVVPAPLDTILKDETAINVHKSAAEAQVYVACGNIIGVM